MDELLAQAKDVVTAIRSQNWKNGGVMVIDGDEAVALVMQLMKTAYSAGLVDATKHTGDMIMRAFDAITAAHS